MANQWTVTDEDGDNERTYPARFAGIPDADDAARMWAEWRCRQEAEYPDQMIAIVTSPEGRVSRWSITIEEVPVFHAREVTRG